MKKIIKWGLIGFIGLVVIGAIAGSSGDSGKSSDNGSETKQEAQADKVEPTQVEAMDVVTADFIKEFDTNQLAAEDKYSDKWVKFTAYINNISEDILGSPFLSLKPTAQEYYFDTSIQCFFEDKSQLTQLANDQKVTLKGKVKSQDLGIISIKECEVVE